MQKLQKRGRREITNAGGRLFSAGLLLGFLGLLGGAANQSWPDWWWAFHAPSRATVFERRVQPFVQANCYECHDSAAKKGDFAIDRLIDPNSLATDREAWERVLEHVSNKLMPPREADQPTTDARTEFVAWLDKALHPIDPEHPDPGHVVIRRLNREEYKNTIRDLLGVTFNPTEKFPEDDTGHGFDHLGEVLTVSPLLFERYLAAAEEIASQVILDPMPPARVQVAVSDQWKNNELNEIPGRASEGEVVWPFSVPAEARYKLKLRVFEDAGGPETTRFTVTARKNIFPELLADGKRGAPREYLFDLDLPAGRSELKIAFLNDFYVAKTETAPAQDRNLYVESATLEGPYPRPGQKPLQAQFPAWVPKREPGEPDEEWVRRAFVPLMRLAYRRPVRTEEATALINLVCSSKESGDSDAAAFQVGLQALLVSPAFLFRGEPLSHQQKTAALSDHALASRLSYFLWSGPPDAKLNELADRGELHTQLRTQVRRMLADPKATRFVDNFAGQWLEVRNLPLRTPDQKLYSAWSRELALSMKGEVLCFFADFLTNKRPILELLTADFTFLDQRMAAYYGLPEPSGKGYVRTSLGEKAGIFRQAGIMTVTSYVNRTSPVLRGKFVLEKILGTPPPPPPPNVPSLSEKVDEKRPVSLRARLEAHRSQPSCASCHALIDPIGFALENYDAIGRWRDSESGQPVDSAGKLVTGEDVRSPQELARVLSTRRGDDFYRNFAGTLLTYAIGRGLDYYDRPTVDRIVEEASESGHTLPAYIEAVVSSIAFQYQRGDTPKSEKAPAILVHTDS